MVKGEDLPVVNMENKFQDAIQVITDKKLGVAVVVDEKGMLKGLLTDGDIRRALQKHTEISGLKVKDVMTIGAKQLQKMLLLRRRFKYGKIFDYFFGDSKT